MIDETTAAYRSAAPRPQPGAAAAVGDKSAFQQTLEEIRDKGFRAYAEDLQAAKLEELRKELLESMGLSEDALAAMSPEARAAVEDMVARKIRERLSAQTLATKGGEPAAPTDPGLAQQLRALPNGLGTELLKLQAQAQASDGRDETR